MTVRRSKRLKAERFRCLVSGCGPGSPALARLEKTLTGCGLLHKRRSVESRAGDVSVRLLVAERHFDMAFRALVELSAELAPAGFPGFVSNRQALRSPATGE